MQNSYFCHIRILTCDFMACNTLHADKKSYFSVADFHRTVLYDYYISIGSLEAFLNSLEEDIVYQEQGLEAWSELTLKRFKHEI